MRIRRVCLCESEKAQVAEQHEEQDGLEARSLCDPANTASQKRKHCPRDSAREPFIMSNPGGYGKRGWNDGGGGPGKRRRPAEAEDGEIEEGEMQEMPHGRGGRGVCPPLTLRCAAAPQQQDAGGVDHAFGEEGDARRLERGHEDTPIALTGLVVRVRVRVRPAKLGGGGCARRQPRRRVAVDAAVGGAVIQAQQA